ncbi:MAG: ankyrin repeat domain-containing protein [Simkaniaceae bacterium]|nr:ankyrin repeat domain-containing protein [Candidatus Sacchlamyda saccharinae]
MDTVLKVGVGAIGVCSLGVLCLAMHTSKLEAVEEKFNRLITTKAALRKEWGSEVHALADHGDLTALKAHIAKNPEDVNKRVYGKQPIHVAARYQHRRVVEYLLSKGADVNAFSHDADRSTPLHIAFENDDVPLIKLLLSKGANMLARDNEGTTPIEGGSVSIAKQFFKDFDFLTWFNGSLPIHDYAIYNPDMARAILSENCGINVPCPRYNNATALHLAAAKGYKKLAQSLIDYGAQVDAQDAMGNTPLHVALRRGNSSLVKLLLNSGARIDIKDHKGRTPLELAAVSYDFNQMGRFEIRYHIERNSPWQEVTLGKRDEEGRFLDEENTYLMDNHTKDLYEIGTSPSKLKFKAVVVSALVPFYLPISVIRQIGGVALDVLRVIKDIFLRIRSYSLIDTLVMRPSKELASVLVKRLKHVAVGPLCCLGLIFAGLYTQYDLNEGRKWMDRIAESWGESYLLRPFSLAKVGNQNMTIIGEEGRRQFQAC